MTPKLKAAIGLGAAMALPILATSCEDNLSDIGNSLAKGEVVISIDSVGFKLNGHSVEAPVIDSRSTTNLLGRLSVPEYGDLQCSFVSRLMCVSELNIPDSIISDSICSYRMTLNIPRGQITGDTLAPQQLSVYKLTRQLPDSITNLFDATGYYDPSKPLGVKSFTASAVAMKDSAFSKLTTIPLSVELPIADGRQILEEYRTNPATFAWPSSFAKYFPGIYVENSFGNGCVINISSVNTQLFYKHRLSKKVLVDSIYVDKVYTKIDSVPVFGSAPEVLSSNNIRLIPSTAVTGAVSDGEVILQSPAGYNVEISFPAQEIIDQYREQSGNMSVVNNLTLSIPVEHTSNKFGITMPPNLLLIKSSELAEFFEKNKVPDDKSSFWGSYSSSTKSYSFTSMREYIVDLIESGQKVDEKDMQFTIVPVAITTETSGSTMMVTSCVPYLARPTLCSLKLNDAMIKFTFSREQID